MVQQKEVNQGLMQSCLRKVMIEVLVDGTWGQHINVQCNANQRPAVIPQEQCPHFVFSPVLGKLSPPDAQQTVS